MFSYRFLREKPGDLVSRIASDEIITDLNDVQILACLRGGLPVAIFPGL